MSPSAYDLRKVRSLLLQNAEIQSYVKLNKNHVENRHLLMSLFFLLLGLAGQLFWASQIFLLAPFFSLLQIAGLTGLSSLSHESWHKRVSSWERLEIFLARFVVNPIFLRQFHETLKAHWSHHRFMGSEMDPDSLVWKQTREEYKTNQVNRLLVAPAAFHMLKGILTNKRVNRRDVAQEILSKPDHFANVIAISIHLLWVSLLVIASPWLLFFGYLLPFAVSAVLANVREYSEHEFSSDGKLVVFDTLCGNWERLFIGGGYFNLHALHHIFPEIPQGRLPGLYNVIETHPSLYDIYYGTTPVIQKKSSYIRGKGRNEE